MGRMARFRSEMLLTSCSITRDRDGTFHPSGDLDVFRDFVRDLERTLLRGAHEQWMKAVKEGLSGAFQPIRDLPVEDRMQLAASQERWEKLFDDFRLPGGGS